MILPMGCLFRPTDEELLIHYLGRKRMGLPLPCDLVIERDIYGAGDKAPWQIFTDQDPWEICKTKDGEGNIIKTEDTIYVFTTLIKAPGKTRIARTAGCGSWHGETAPKKVVDDNGFLIGHKKMLCFEITDESGLVMDGGVKRGHWIMHEYSLCRGDDSEGGYVVCRIKRVGSKDTKKRLDDSKCTKKPLRKVKNGEAAATMHYDGHGMVPKPAKRARTEFVQEKNKMECDIAAARETHQVVPLLEDVFVQDQNIITMGDYRNKFGFDDLVGDLGGLVPVVEQQENFSFNYDYGVCDNISFSTEVALAPETEIEPFVEDESYILGDDALNEFTLEGLDELFAGYDAAFGNMSLPTECVPSGVENSDDYGPQHLNPSNVSVQNPVLNENLWSAELPTDQESDSFWQQFTGFHATAEPLAI